MKQNTIKPAHQPHSLLKAGEEDTPPLSAQILPTLPPQAMNLEPPASPLPLPALPPGANTIMGAEEVLERLTAQARGTLAPFLAESASGWFADLSSEEAQANLGLLKKAKFKRRVLGGEENPIVETEVEVELHDPQAALRDLGRHHKLFTDRAESVEVGLLKVEIEYIDRD